MSESQLETVAGGIIVVDSKPTNDDGKAIIITGGKSIIDDGKQDIVGNTITSDGGR